VPVDAGDARGFGGGGEREFIVDRRGLKDISVVARYQQVTRGQAESAL
jgi:hypothetical protein